MRSRIAGAAGSFSGPAARPAPPNNPTYQTLDGTFKGQWAKGEKKTVTTAGGELEAINHIAAISAPTTDPGGPCAIAWNGYEWCVVAPFGGGSVRLAKTSSDWEKDSSVSLAIYGGSPGSEAATGETVSAYNHFGKVLSGKWVMIGESPDGNNYLIAPEADQQDVVYNVAIVSTTAAGVTASKLVFYRKKAWVHSVEEGTPVEIGMTECVTPYSQPAGGGY